jgi:signal transduction histidine kinase/DNA-binding response OmpR family regulator
MEAFYFGINPSKYNLVKLCGFLCIVCLISFSCRSVQMKTKPIAENGVLDLTGWDFEHDGIVALNGSWKYIWMHDSPDYSKAQCNVSGWNNIVVPAIWINTVHESYGYGWLRLKVITRTDKNLRLYLKIPSCASDIYCNGKKLFSFGVTGNSQNNYHPERSSKSILLPECDTLNLAWKLVNYADRLGGPKYSLIIGNDNDILKYVSKLNFQITLTFGVIFIMFVYHILIWYRRRRDLPSLYFGLFCLIIAVRLFVNEIVYLFSFDFLLWFYIFTKIEFLTLPLGSAAILLFISKLFPEESLKKIELFLHGIFVTLALITIFTSLKFYCGIINLYQLSVLLVIVTCLIIIFRALIKRRVHAKIVLSGSLVMGFCVVYDILITHLPTDTGFITSLGLVFFIIIQSSVLSFKFADAYNTAEHLSKNLKDEVDLKTNDIQLKSEELKKINSELKKADEYKTRFFQNFTHEFKTPLTLITGPVHSVLNGLYGEISQTVRKQLEVVKQNGLKTVTLVNQILELARSDVKRLELKLAKHNIDDTLKSILANFESLAKKNKIKIAFVAENTSLVYSLIDIEKFERIFYNLLSNSFKFTKANDSVQLILSYMNDSDKYVITVKDTGIGISEENIPYIFNRFYKANIHGIADSQGTGIGLALVKEYTALHGGQIKVSSMLGTGTEFTLEFPVMENKTDIEKYLSSDYSNIEFIDNLYLPVHLVQNEIEYYIKSADTDIDSKDESINDEPKELKNRDKTIVIVEDNSDMRSYIIDILKKDYEVTEAKNGEEGFDAVIATMPDLIISDVMMPRMDGIELCRKLKTDIRTEHIPVIILTALSSSSDSIEGYSIGADDYISKPFSRELLLVRITNLIESRNKIREHFKSRFLLEPEYNFVESNVEKFIRKAISAVECNITNTNFNVELFAAEIGISQIQLYRKLTSIVGQSPAEFMRVVRLKRAAKILEESIEKDINISEIANSLGFSSSSYFSTLYKKHFGISPTDYAKKFQ